MLPTEPIGSIPRPKELVDAILSYREGQLDRNELDEIYDQSIRDTLEAFETTGSPVITDGEQTKPLFEMYPVCGLENVDPQGIKINCKNGRVLHLPRLTEGPFQYKTYADAYLDVALKYANRPVKQNVISPSSLSLIYPEEGIENYPREKFLEDLVDEAEKEIRLCLGSGAYNVQMNFSEALLAFQLDPGKEFLKSLINIDNRVLKRFSTEEQKRIGIHICPRGAQGASQNRLIDYVGLLPLLFPLNVGSFYIQFAGETDKERILQYINKYLGPEQMVFLGVIDVSQPAIEHPEKIRDMILKAAEYIPVIQLGTTDDCGFSAFSDDLAASRKMAFEMIRVRLQGTRMASEELNI